MTKKEQKVLEIKQKISEYFTEKKASGDVGSASSLLSETDINKIDINNSTILFNTLKGYIMAQAIRLPKHAHESVMADFDENFGRTGDKNVVNVAIIKNTSIDVKDFIKMTEDEDK